MTIITRETPTDLVVRPARPRPDVRRRPRAHRPQGAAMPHRGTGVLMSRASHRRRPLTPASTVVLALVAAAITVWLGLVAQLGETTGSAETPAAVPTRLAVVQVQTGETLQQLAQRIAPDAPAGAMVDEIRELNKLDTSAVAAGQTLIAPVG
ncbi:LysM peptidoglycan-binding domain-containing protein [Mycolicibacterium arenosum]|uniref:LysM peptidoglycan-binding domain-containing protein n=1 Tax=Mycolicibacterium arenosum TaxID=2952157 RepID=A0ABT1M1S9_9MYCO|nr:LysM peptidoglycan-binding domain-containing protein [Mycolicibacterium sp. CAU 1645]MCP9273098.1 LysM peptidoglycan-binding domain-containing protein [Mycolicibacterium sp. CAU 1645]